ncbi:hypothetical protein ACFSFW_23475 [Fredinandcohnia salidurans]|uniref:Uncharacterized protein n=1 Tax=Fredinandcohnia salidurans TaxID=2595041 RepID=A0ABW4MVJ6_9BACI
MEFERIPVILKRYDFGAKMAICQKSSMEIMSTNGLIEVKKLREKVLPWELETFALFSVTTVNEYSNQKFETEKDNRRFIDIIATIRNYKHPRLKLAHEKNKFVDYFLIVTGLTQFQIQESTYYKLYRYNYMFNFKNNNIDMKEHFIKKFGVDYEEFVKFGFLLRILYANKVPDPKIILYLFGKYNHVLKWLMIEREKFVSLQEKFTSDITQYIYGFKYFYQFPFISYKQTIYMPLPHLLLQSVTTSLLFRLTEGNGELRQLFGKDVLENYLIHICNFSTCFDEVASDYAYKYKGGERRTLDIMIRKGDQCFMLDSKSMVPRAALRDLSEDAIDATLNRMVDSVVQVYRHLVERFQIEYYPFAEKIKFNREDIFGAVILLEDSYYRREEIMTKAAEVLKINLEGAEFKYLCSNVKILSLYEIESMIFQNEDVFELLMKNRNNKQNWFDYSLSNDLNNKEKRLINNISEFMEDIKQYLYEFVEEIEEKGLIV